MIELLAPEHLPNMLALQQHCVDNGDTFTPTSERGYALCYQFHNFCLGVWDEQRDQLVAFLCCTIPTSRASRNFGRGRVPGALLDSVGHMNTLLIRSGHRGQGLGKALMREGIDQLHARGASHIYAVVSPENSVSRHMLGMLGFREAERVELNGAAKLLFCLADQC